MSEISAVVLSKSRLSGLVGDKSKKKLQSVPDGSPPPTINYITA